MDSVTVASVGIDKGGVIISLDGAADRFGLDSQIIGRPWNDAFPDWDMPPLPSLSPDEYPCRLQATAPSCQTVEVSLFWLSQANREPLIHALLSGDAAVTLTDRQQQLCALGELSAAVAHEINNALTLLQGWLDLIHADLPEGDANRQTLELLLGESQRIARLTGNLLQVARGAQETSTSLNVSDLIGEVVSLVNYEMRNSDIEIENALPDHLPLVSGSSGRLKQALLNLLVNARQAMPNGGKVRISAQGGDDGNLAVVIEDTGCGMSPDVRNRVFSPFFTTKENGTGLGLPVTRKIIEDHGGTLELESQASVGTRFTLRLPIMAE